MKIEIVEDGGRRDTDPAGTEAEAAEESSAGDGRKRKSRKILAEVRKALFMAVVAAVVARPRRQRTSRIFHLLKRSFLSAVSRRD